MWLGHHCQGQRSTCADAIIHGWQQQQVIRLHREYNHHDVMLTQDTYIRLAVSPCKVDLRTNVCNIEANAVHRKSSCSPEPANIPVLGLSSCEHSVTSLVSSFTSRQCNSKELPAYTQHGKCIWICTDHVWTHKHDLFIITKDNNSRFKY